MEQQYGICRVAVAALRAEPSDKAEIASQLLFGDQVEILEQTDKWLFIRNAYDGYEGWVDFKQLGSLSAEQYAARHYYDTLVPAQPLNVITAADGGKYYLSPGSVLPAYENGCCYLGKDKFNVSFLPQGPDAQASTERITATALFFQNVPYQWGGRTLFGIDCSGFVQTVFKLNGIKLKRDAWQQAEQGSTVDFLPEVQPGDVAFFDNTEGRIIHVGILLNANEIIHASGKVKIDAMDSEGIYSAELGRYTHKLRIIKRFI
ncbi:cell wall-associated NlpC family hydrolase [Pedobacter sp. AK017]|uniref:C40 family peptidase n=1 Tax=Pedobacter sp. AK017 TaxID=2723073 RepID=UPI001622EA29|nr:C40 family peptidase [Pedobacter sp. AK017]MBB5439453.1 cell wall-associated NlpC family hydrolase [Pedobacter sp. AK017]